MRTGKLDRGRAIVHHSGSMCHSESFIRHQAFSVRYHTNYIFRITETTLTREPYLDPQYRRFGYAGNLVLIREREYCRGFQSGGERRLRRGTKVTQLLLVQRNCVGFVNSGQTDNGIHIKHM